MILLSIICFISTLIVTAIGLAFFKGEHVTLVIVSAGFSYLWVYMWQRFKLKRLITKLELNNLYMYFAGLIFGLMCIIALVFASQMSGPGMLVLLIISVAYPGFFALAINKKTLDHGV
jgi:hypothetical protein